MGNGRTWAQALRRRLGLARRDGERGAVLVEAVIVIPILMLITLGIIEYGSAYQQDAAVAAASRAGARVGSALSKTNIGCASSCNGATDAGVTIAAAVSSALQSVGSATPTQMWIYRYEPNDTATCKAPSFSGCAYKVGYAWSSANKSFTTSSLVSGSVAWPATAQYACASSTQPNLVGGTGPDQIGIYVQMTHTAVTHLFGGSKTLTGTTIMRLEPDVNSDCTATGISG